MDEANCKTFSSKIEIMAREENLKTIYTIFEDSYKLQIIPDSEFKIDSNNQTPMI